MEIKTIGSGSSGNGYFVSDGHTQILLEAGMKFETVQKFLNFKTRKIKACLVTHSHLDHAKYAQQYLDNGIPVFMTNGTKNDLRINHYRLSTIQYKILFTVGSFTILAFATEHDTTEPCGYLLHSHKTGERLLFVTDSYYIRYRAQSVTHMLLEVNHDYDYMMKRVENGELHQALANRIMNSHLNIENAVKYLKATDLSKLKEIHLIHLSKDNAKANEFKEIIQGVTGVPVKIAGR